MVTGIIGFAAVHALVSGVIGVAVLRCLPKLHFLIAAILSSIIVTATAVVVLLALSDRHERPVSELLWESLTNPLSQKLIAGLVVVGVLGAAVILWIRDMGRRADALS